MTHFFTDTQNTAYSIDMEAFSYVKEVMADSFQAMIDAFIATSAEVKDGLPHALDTKDYSQLTIHAHTYKSASANFGFTGVSKLAAQLEADLRNGMTDIDVIESKMDKLLGELDNTTRWLEDYSRKNSANGSQR